MTSIYNKNEVEKLIKRIDLINKESKPLWGKMNAGQMLKHCSEVQMVLQNGKKLENVPFLVKLMKGFIKKSLLNTKPFKKNTPTPSQYIIKSCCGSDVEKEKEILRDLLLDLSNNKISRNHSLFGELTAEEVSTITIKHIDHHLNQFGV